MKWCPHDIKYLLLWWWWWWCSSCSWWCCWRCDIQSCVALAMVESCRAPLQWGYFLQWHSDDFTSKIYLTKTNPKKKEKRATEITKYLYWEWWRYKSKWKWQPRDTFPTNTEITAVANNNNNSSSNNNYTTI